MKGPQPGDGMTNAWPPPQIPKPPTPIELPPRKTKGERIAHVLVIIVGIIFLGALALGVHYIYTSDPSPKKVSDFNEDILRIDMMTIGLDPATNPEFIDQMRQLCSEDPHELADFIIANSADPSMTSLIAMLIDTCPIQMAKVQIIYSNTATTGPPTT